MSIADPLGQRAYQTEDAFKGDNNVFRMVWWRAAIAETIDTNGWFGLGFGHDLAGRFVQQYLPRRPNSPPKSARLLVTVFARMGIVGFVSFLAFISAIAMRTWRALRDPDLAFISGAWWAATWVVLICACFGVVLEGRWALLSFGRSSGSPALACTTLPNAQRSQSQTNPSRIGIAADCERT